MGGGEPVWRQLFDSPIDIVVREAWEEQRAIGWDQILKGRISSKWGQAYGMFYMSNPTTRKEKYLSKEVWTSKTIAELL